MNAITELKRDPVYRAIIKITDWVQKLEETWLLRRKQRRQQKRNA